MIQFFVVETTIRQQVIADNPGEAMSIADTVVDRIKAVAPGLLKSAQIKAISFPAKK